MSILEATRPPEKWPFGTLLERVCIYDVSDSAVPILLWWSHSDHCLTLLLHLWYCALCETCAVVLLPLYMYSVTEHSDIWLWYDGWAFSEEEAWAVKFIVCVWSPCSTESYTWKATIFFLMRGGGTFSDVSHSEIVDSLQWKFSWCYWVPTKLLGLEDTSLLMEYSAVEDTWCTVFCIFRGYSYHCWTFISLDTGILISWCRAFSCFDLCWPMSTSGGCHYVTVTGEHSFCGGWWKWLSD